jgi:hypothetical protein
MSSPPPGWYDDGRGAQRWWDGTQWTEHTQASANTPVPASPQVPADPYSQTDDASLGLGAPTYASAAGVPGAGVADAGPLGGPPPRKKSNLWIVWVVIGVFVLGLVITAIVLIPMLLAGALGAGGAQPANDDEKSAVHAVELYDDAWSEVDCDKFFAATTEAFRAQIDLQECAAFESQAQAFGESTDQYDLSVTGITRDGGTITVATTETYQALTDDDNQPLATPEPTEVHYEYYVVADGDHWAIDDAASD